MEWDKDVIKERGRMVIKGHITELKISKGRKREMHVEKGQKRVRA